MIEDHEELLAAGGMGDGKGSAQQFALQSMLPGTRNAMLPQDATPATLAHVMAPVPSQQQQQGPAAALHRDLVQPFGNSTRLPFLFSGSTLHISDADAPISCFLNQ